MIWFKFHPTHELKSLLICHKLSFCLRSIKLYSFPFLFLLLHWKNKSYFIEMNNQWKSVHRFYFPKIPHFPRWCRGILLLYVYNYRSVKAQNLQPFEFLLQQIGSFTFSVFYQRISRLHGEYCNSKRTLIVSPNNLWISLRNSSNKSIWKENELSRLLVCSKSEQRQLNYISRGILNQ